MRTPNYELSGLKFAEQSALYEHQPQPQPQFDLGYKCPIKEGTIACKAIVRKVYFYILRKFLSVVETHSWYDSTSKTPPTREPAEFLGRELGCKTLEQ